MGSSPLQQTRCSRGPLGAATAAAAAHASAADCCTAFELFSVCLTNLLQQILQFLFCVAQRPQMAWQSREQQRQREMQQEQQQQQEQLQRESLITGFP
ncbi:hypothetical protein ETH_00023910 [Eimeria tenella]|uniref:Uncharacterized protein n=1 Tax=Eimeria tenella TaxID=5802 RepID=U6L063_EIMTE|nr:hypothetical protein ETH_00023910 [Eimeria tenella]CDJ41150.1 hypothetical protein ETH_00023910 [Eimeria tenella]|eukprot:XP_013231900.1 hypothetical protein ETH_00023910 [Eimeria tenella]